MYWVSKYRLNREATANMPGFWSWLRNWDDNWFAGQRRMSGQEKFPYQSSAYYLTLAGEPSLEIWLQVPNFAALEESRKMASSLSATADWRSNIDEFNRYLEFVESRLVEDAPIPVRSRSQIGM